jgi:rfaE bifunctional protein nucleotidyltransferase chain/domain
LLARLDGLLFNPMLLSLPDTITLCNAHCDQGQRIVLTNGVFDLLHVGHVDYLEKARALGDALIVGVNSDASAHQLKREGRPFVPAAERAQLVAALRCVDAAVIFEDFTADNLIRALRPNIYVKGGDYTEATLPEAESARAVRAEIKLIEYLPNHSTTALIEKILSTKP